MKNNFTIDYKIPYAASLAGAIILFLPSVKRALADGGHRWLSILLLSFALSFCLVPLFRFLAMKCNVVDLPNARKVHQKATPLLGGAPIFAAFIVSLFYNGIFTPTFLAIVAGGALMFFVGVWDDARRLSAKFKMLVQILAVILLLSQGIMLRVVHENLGWFALLTNGMLTFLWIIGITNAFNFFDGMDGLAGGLGAILAFFLAILAFQTNNPVLGWISLGMIGGCLGFLPYNLRLRQSATIFLGDGGSTFIGFVLASLAVYGEWSATSPIAALTAPVLIFWILIFDMIHITVDRIQTGKVTNFHEWLEYTGKDHLHHRLARVLGGPRRSVLFIYCMSFCLGISAVVLRNAQTATALLLILQASIIVILLTILERRGRHLASDNENRKEKQ